MALQYIEEELADFENPSNNWCPRWCHEFYKKLSELFHDSVTAQEVADFIASLEDVKDEKKIEGTLWTLWGAIWRIAVKDEGVHQHLLDLLEALSRQADVHYCYGMTVWRDLPIFGWQARDQYNYFDIQIDDLPEDSTSECVAQKRSAQIVQRERGRLEYQNQNAFLAKLTELDHRKDIPRLDFDIFGLCTMRDALEGDNWTRNFSTIKRDGKTIDNPTHLDGSVPAAAQWVFHNGVEMFRNELDFTPTRRNQGSHPGLGGALWKGKEGFCRERWDLWQNRMEEVAEMQNVMERTRDYARRAYGMMKMISEA